MLKVRFPRDNPFGGLKNPSRQKNPQNFLKNLVTSSGILFYVYSLLKIAKAAKAAKAATAAAWLTKE